MSDELPIFRIMTVMMLASLVSTLFALPAFADNPLITNVGSAPVVLPGGAYSYTVVVTNDATPDSNVVVTDTLTNATASSMPSFVMSTAPATVVPCAGAGPYVCTAPNIGNAETMTITVPVTAGVAGPASNLASVATNHTAGPATATANTTVQNADLQVTKTHTGTTTPGGALTYTITVHNNGPSDAAGVTLTDTAPTGITFGTVVVSSVPAGISTCTTTTATSIACSSGWAIPNGMTVTVTVPATLSLSATGSIANTATTTATSLDATSGNNASTDTFTVGAGSADLAVTLTVAPTTAAPGDTVTYTVGVQNLDLTTDATNVVVTDTLPTGLTAVTPPTTPSTGTAAVASNVWTWTLPTVAKSTTVTTTFDATVDSSTSLTTITNTAGITAATQTDPVSTNNTASADLTIQAASADVSVTLSSDNPSPQSGDTIKITLQISNKGPADATNVVVQDTYSSGLKYLSCGGCSPATGIGLRSSLKGQKKASSQQFTAPLIANGFSASATLSFKVTATQGTVTNKASVLSMDQSDPAAANNKNNLSLKISFSNNSGSGSGTGSGSGSTGTGTSGSSGTAFTGFTAGQLIPWFMLFGSLGLVALEYSRRRPLVAPIGHTWGFEPWQRG